MLQDALKKHAINSNLDDFILSTLIALHGCPVNIWYNPYDKVWKVEYVKFGN